MRLNWIPWLDSIISKSGQENSFVRMGAIRINVACTPSSDATITYQKRLKALTLKMRTLLHFLWKTIVLMSHLGSDYVTKNPTTIPVILRYRNFPGHRIYLVVNLTVQVVNFFLNRSVFDHFSFFKNSKRILFVTQITKHSIVNN